MKYFSTVKIIINLLKFKNMKTNQNSKNEAKINNDFILENQILDIEGLMKVEGGVDNDEDWCVFQQCASGAKTCYTGA
jgi:hypothetical protein